MQHKHRQRCAQGSNKKDETVLQKKGATQAQNRLKSNLLTVKGCQYTSTERIQIILPYRTSKRCQHTSTEWTQILRIYDGVQGGQLAIVR